jgi:hypothetical protein
MALGHTTKKYGVNDAKIHKLSTDVAATAPTYAAAVDVPGVKSLKTTLSVDTKTLRGDNTLLSADSVLSEISGTVEYARFSFDIWTALTNALATDAGTTPNQTVTMAISQSTLPAFAKVEAQTLQTDYVGGDVHIIFWKAMPGSMPVGLEEEDYDIQSFDFMAVPTIGTPASNPANAWLTYVANETLVAVA